MGKINEVNGDKRYYFGSLSDFFGEMRAEITKMEAASRRSSVQDARASEEIMKDLLRVERISSIPFDKLMALDGYFTLEPLSQSALEPADPTMWPKNVLKHRRLLQCLAYMLTGLKNSDEYLAQLVVHKNPHLLSLTEHNIISTLSEHFSIIITVEEISNENDIEESNYPADSSARSKLAQHVFMLDLGHGFFEPVVFHVVDQITQVTSEIIRIFGTKSQISSVYEWKSENLLKPTQKHPEDYKSTNNFHVIENLNDNCREEISTFAFICQSMISVSKSKIQPRKSDSFQEASDVSRSSSTRNLEESPHHRTSGAHQRRNNKLKKTFSSLLQISGYVSVNEEKTGKKTFLYLTSNQAKVTAFFALVVAALISFFIIFLQLLGVKVTF